MIELDPDDRKATIRLAQLLLNERRNPQEAEPLFQRVVDEQPDNAEGKTGLAQCLAARGQTQEALQQLDDVLREAPTNVNALVERGKVALILQRYQSAETDLRKALDLARYDPRVYYNLLLALKGQKGREKDAEAMSADLARVNTDHRRMEELIKKYTSDANNVGLLVEVAQIYLRYDLPREAMPFLNRALDRAPYDPKVHASLAEAWAKLGNLDQARIHRQQAGLPSNSAAKK